MNPDYRAMLLATMARIEQQSSEAESLTVEVPDDEVLQNASRLLSDFRRVLADVERKLSDPYSIVD